MGLLIFTIFPLKHGVNVVTHTTPHGHVSRVVQFHLPNIFIKPRHNIKNTSQQTQLSMYAKCSTFQELQTSKYSIIQLQLTICVCPSKLTHDWNVIHVSPRFECFSHCTCVKELVIIYHVYNLNQWRQLMANTQMAILALVPIQTKIC